MLNDQATAIKAILEAIDTPGGVGVVHDHAPNPAPSDYAAMVDTFTVLEKDENGDDIPDTRQIRAWTIQYLGEARAWTAIAIGATKTVRHPRWMVRAHLSWSEHFDTETTFRNLVEAAVVALDTNRSLGGTALDHDPVQVDVPFNGAGVALGDVLVHYAELTLTAKVEQTLATT